MVDWKGNVNSAYTCNGASNHSERERERDDYYATDPETINDLLKLCKFDKDIWECASGEDHLANKLRELGYNVRSSDLIKRLNTTEVLDFLVTNEVWCGDIITNPPYKYADEFVRNGMNVLQNGQRMAMFLKLTFLETQSRKLMFQEYPPKIVGVYSKRVSCALNGEFNKTDSKAVAYAWYIWQKGWKGDPIIKWI